nr:D-alanyl-D-alanine carboxypeptidase family protein [Vulcanibacillus modesticaldus]
MVVLPSVYAEEVDLATNAKSAILIDQDTGTILFEKNSHQPLPPASLTKIMTMLLVMEAIDSGKITLDDKVRVSEYAASMGGSQIFLEAGEEMSVRDLLKGVAVASGNDASVALAEYIAGSEEAFVAKMNEKAKELGLKNTHFMNSNGLPVKNHYTSAYDIAVISRELLKYEQITRYTGIYQDYLRKNTKNPFWLVNTNRLVRFYKGVDGLKTGYTTEAKFCLAATAKRGKFRVIAVVMGAPSTKIRNKEVSRLLDYAFSQYKNEVIYEKNQPVINAKVSKGKKDYVSLITPYQISVLMKKEEKLTNYEKVIIVDENIIAPIEKGEVLGKLQTIKDGKVVQTFPLIAEENINKASLWDMIKKTTKSQLLLSKNSE